MQVSQTHIIRRQNIKVNATVLDSFALKQKIERFAEDMAPKLSSLFDGMVSEKEWMEIGKLDIEIDDLLEEDLEEKLTQRVIESIRDKIAARNYSVSVDKGISQNGINIVHTESEKEGGYKLVPIHQKMIEALIYFLKHGILPWWFETTSPTRFEEELTASLDMFLNETKDERRQITLDIQSALRNASAQKRLAEQFQPLIYTKVVHLVTQTVGTDTFSEINMIYKAIDKILSSKTEANIVGLSLSPEQYLDELKQIAHFSRLSLLDSLTMSGNTYELLNNWLLKIYQSLKNHQLQHLQKVFLENEDLKRYLTDHIKTPLVELASKIMTNAPEKPKTEDAKRKPVKIKSNKSIEELAKEDGLIISNAGLVIVSTFLPHLFEHCGIINDHKITDFAKAIALMHYTVYKHCDYREYDVLLNKILCGLDANEPVALLQELSDQEMSEVETMLTAIISHWSALGGTSPDGLREGFLLRKGSLIYKHEEWFLQVEQKSLDLLLDQLPWTIGYIKLPWMKAGLKVEWR
jgi:hypothetical protein